MFDRIASPHPPGKIIVPAAWVPRYWEFMGALDRLQVPAGTSLAIPRSCDVAGNLNRGMQTLGPDDAWAWFLGDDHLFEADILMRLLARQVNVVVPINVVKILPLRPLVYHGPYGEKMPLYHWEDFPPGLWALPEGDFTGQAGMLVRRPVLDRIGYPWFRPGQLDPGKLQEDMTFCRDLQRLGETVWIDCDQVLDHMFTFTASARRNADGVYEPVIKSGRVQLALGNLEPPRPLAMANGSHRPPLQWAAVPEDVSEVGV